MPQLQGNERKILFDLLVEHVDANQLARALENHGLPPLNQLAGDGDVRHTTDKVINALERQYRIIELIEAALNELDNHCPPIQQFLEANRAKWERRRDHPTLLERAANLADLSGSTRGCITITISISLCLLVAFFTFHSAFNSFRDSRGLKIVGVSFVEVDHRKAPDGHEYDERVLKLDVRVVNRGPRRAELYRARLNVERAWKVRAFEYTGSVLEPSGEYLLELPLDESAPYSAVVPIPLTLDAEEADRFLIRVQGEGGGIDDHVRLATLTLSFDEDKLTVTSEPFVIAVGPDNAFWDFEQPLDITFFTNPAFTSRVLEARRATLIENKALLPQLRDLTKYDSTGRFRRILKVISDAPEPEAIPAITKPSAEEVYRHLKRAFFIQVYGSLIHPQLVPAVFNRMRHLDRSELTSEIEARLVSEYETSKEKKLEWLRNDVEDSLPLNDDEKEFLLPEGIRLNDDDTVRLDRSCVQNEIEFIYGKLQGRNLSDAMIATFVKGTLESRLRILASQFPGARNDPQLAAELLSRAVFEQLGLIGNSRRNIELALRETGRRVPWTAGAVDGILGRFDEIVLARRAWIDDAQAALETATGPIVVPVPEAARLSLVEPSEGDAIAVRRQDQRALEREQELLIANLDGDSSAAAANAAFEDLIVRFAAMNVVREYRKSIETAARVGSGGP